MPQISQLAATYASQIFWLIVTFGLVFVVVGRGMLPKVQATMAGRDQRIASDLAAATAARDTADRAEGAWRTRDLAIRERAQSVIVDARSRAAKTTEATLSATNAEQAGRLAEREAEIRAAAERAMAEIESVAADAAQAIAARVAGLDVSPEDARSAVRQVLTHA